MMGVLGEKVGSGGSQGAGGDRGSQGGGGEWGSSGGRWGRGPQDRGGFPNLGRRLWRHPLAAPGSPILRHPGQSGRTPPRSTGCRVETPSGLGRQLLTRLRPRTPGWGFWLFVSPGLRGPPLEAHFPNYTLGPRWASLAAVSGWLSSQREISSLWAPGDPRPCWLLAAVERDTSAPYGVGTAMPQGPTLAPTARPGLLSRELFPYSPKTETPPFAAAAGLGRGSTSSVATSCVTLPRLLYLSEPCLCM